MERKVARFSFGVRVRDFGEKTDGSQLMCRSREKTVFAPRD